MNKTVNINLAGIFFHIDEDAYARLQRYLDAVKNSFSNTQGREEIIADIEARIAELFNEKLKNDRQVISLREVEEVIAIMGQPEDYMVDEEIFEDEPSYRQSTGSAGKKLFRDTNSGYIGGVSSGLGHYLGVDAIWLRVLWILLTIFSSGAFILIYIAFWIFVPEAKTTAEKLAMRGEEVTISNIEKKIREGFNDVSDSLKNVDYEKYGKKASAGASSAATSLGRFVRFCLKLVVKFVGILLLLIAGSTLIGLFVGLFAIGTFGLIEAPWTDYIEMVNTGAPLWLVALLSFFAIGIPFFFLFILGLKLLVSNLKSLGRIASLTLLGLWLLSVIGLTIIGVSHATHRAYDGEVITTERLNITANDTLYIRMKSNPDFSDSFSRSSDFKVKYIDGKRILVGKDIRLIVKSTRDSIGKMEIMKTADGGNYEEAKERAENIDYSTKILGNELLLNSYFTTDSQYKFRDQEIELTLYIPEGTVIFADKNTYYYHRNTDSYGDILNNGDEGYFLKVMDNETICLDCPADTWDEESGDTWDEDQNWEESEDDWDTSDDFDASVKVNENGVDINLQEIETNSRKKKISQININENGIHIKSN